MENNHKNVFLLLLSGVLIGGMLLFQSCHSSKKVADEPLLQNSPLTNSYWKLIGLNDSLIHPTQERIIYLKFEDSSRVSGFAGCNGTGGRYSLGRDSHLKISDMISTKMACPDLNIENAFFKSLEETATYSIHADTLILYNKAKVPVSRLLSVADVGAWK